MEIQIDPTDSHPSGLKPIGSNPVFCPKKNVDHRTDTLKELHGTPEKPILVEETHPRKYINWEYEYILRKMPSPYIKCLQELLEAENPHRDLDRIVVRDIGGNHHVFYFDMTAGFKAEGVRIAKAVEDYEAGRPVDASDRKAILNAIRVKKDATKRGS